MTRNVELQNYGRPMQSLLRCWNDGQEDLLISLLAREEIGNAMALPRLARMLQANPGLLHGPVQARTALTGMLLAHGHAATDALTYTNTNETPKEGLLDLAQMLLPLALQCEDKDIANPPPADLFSASLVARTPTILHTLLSRGDRPTWTIFGLPPLHYAARTDQVQAMELLLAHDAGVHQVDANGDTPLHHASSKLSVELLLKNGADPRATNAKGEAPPQAWARRTQDRDRARLEPLLKALMGAPSTAQNKVHDFFLLANTHNMGRLKTFARKMGVGYCARDNDQGMVFHATLRLARETLTTRETTGILSQNGRIASNWLGFLAQDKDALSAMTDIEKSGAVALADALAPFARPPMNIKEPAPAPAGYLRHVVLALARSMNETRSTPRTQVRKQIQKLFMGALDQCLEMNDSQSNEDALFIADFALKRSASVDMVQHLAQTLATGAIHVPSQKCDDLAHAACQSAREASRYSASSGPLLEEGVAALVKMISHLDGPLPQTQEYIRKWDEYVGANRRNVMRPLISAAQHKSMLSNTPSAPSTSRTPRF